MTEIKHILCDVCEKSRNPTKVEIELYSVGIGIKIEGCETYDGGDTSIYLEVVNGIPCLLIYPLDNEEPTIIPLRDKND